MKFRKVFGGRALELLLLLIVVLAACQSMRRLRGGGGVFASGPEKGGLRRIAVGSRDSSLVIKRLQGGGTTLELGNSVSLGVRDRVGDWAARVGIAPPKAFLGPRQWGLQATSKGADCGGALYASTKGPLVKLAGLSGHIVALSERLQFGEALYFGVAKGRCGAIVGDVEGAPSVTIVAGSQEDGVGTIIGDWGVSAKGQETLMYLDGQRICRAGWSELRGAFAVEAEGNQVKAVRIEKR